MKTRKQYDDEIAKLAAERDSLPPAINLEELPPGIYTCITGPHERVYFLKAEGRSWSNMQFLNGQAENYSVNLQSSFDEYRYQELERLCGPEPQKQPVCNHQSADGQTTLCVISDLTKQINDLEQNSLKLGPVIDWKDADDKKIYTFCHRGEIGIGWWFSLCTKAYKAECTNIREVLIDGL